MLSRGVGLLYCILMFIDWLGQDQEREVALVSSHSCRSFPVYVPSHRLYSRVSLLTQVWLKTYRHRRSSVVVHDKLLTACVRHASSTCLLCERPWWLRETGRRQAGRGGKVLVLRRLHFNRMSVRRLCAAKNTHTQGSIEPGNSYMYSTVLIGTWYL